MVDGLAAWYAKGFRHRVEDETLFYRDSAPAAGGTAPSSAGGTAPSSAGAAPRETVLLLHGFPTSSWDWRAVWDALAAHYRLIAPDLPGFGFSDKPVRDYRIAGQADAVSNLLATLGIARVHVLAHDYGDTVAQELMARRQRGDGPAPALASVCLLNGGLFPEAQRPLRLQRALASPAGHWLVHLLGKRQALDSLRGVFGADTPPSEGDLEDYWSLITREGGLAVIPALLNYLNERRAHRERWAAALAGDIPVRLVVGMLDRVSGPAVAARFCELLPDPDVVEIDSVGHYPQCESPDAVIDAFLAFAGRHRAA